MNFAGLSTAVGVEIVWSAFHENVRSAKLNGPSMRGAVDLTPSNENPMPETVTWSAYPARQRLGAAVMGVVVIALLAVCAAWLGGSYWWGLLTGVVMMLALNRFYFPSQYSIDDDGIEARYPLGRKRLQWKDVRRFLHDSHGGYLSTRSRASRFDAYRGMHLLFGADRERVVGLIAGHCHKNESIRGFLEDSSSPASAVSGQSIAAEGGAR